MAADGIAQDEQETVLAALVGPGLDTTVLSQREHVLLAYSDKLTRDPSAITAGDIAALREVGLSDRAIHDACTVVAYFAFVNRIADGLGVELEGSGPV